jgi:hypothetical protein
MDGAYGIHGRNKTICNPVVVKPEGMRTFGIRRFILQDTVKMHLNSLKHSYGPL